MCPCFPQVSTSSLLQVSTLSDLQPYMGQFTKHLQDSDASALRNSVVIEQVLRLPINKPPLGGTFQLYLAVCFSAGMWLMCFLVVGPMNKGSRTGSSPHDITRTLQLRWPC